MKKIILIFFCFFGLLLTSCSADTNSQKQNDNKSDKLKIITTNFPSYDFAREISDDCAVISMLLPLGAESHTFEPTPQDIINISKCDLFIYTGGESDSWINDILETLDFNDSKIISMIDLCEKIEINYEHSHNKVEYDEHVWTSPKNAKVIVKEICDKLCTISPENADMFTENYTLYAENLDKLDLELSETVNNAKRNTLIFADRFPFSYLAKDYNLEYYSAFPGCSSETEPDIKTVTALIDKVKEENIPNIFCIEYSNQKLANTIASETGAKILTLHSCHNVTEEEYELGASYIDIMAENILALKEALN